MLKAIASTFYFLLSATMRIHFVSFATSAFRPRQRLLELSAKHVGKADFIHTWNPKRLAASGYISRHAELFPESVGFGWYSWKPYIIQKTLETAADGDLVVYQDVGRRGMILTTHALSFWNDYLDNAGQPCIPGVEIPGWGPNRKWTKKYAFDGLGLQSEKFLECPQIQASWSAWKNCPISITFIAEWATACANLDLVGGQLPNGREAEHKDFIEHRWDQSLLTLLAKKHELIGLKYPESPHIGFNDKSCNEWMKVLGAEQLNQITSLFLNFLACFYSLIEYTMKRISKLI
jgi:hypothetical protein